MSAPVRYRRSPRSAREIAAYVERSIADGVLAPGEALPTVRAQAAELEVSPTTVSAAYRWLAQRGLLVGDGRRGTRVAAGPQVPSRLPVVVPAGVRDLAYGNPDPSLLPDIRPSLARVMRRSQTPQEQLYGGPPRSEALMALARDRFTADGIPADRLAVVSGALDGIERVLGAHLTVGDRVVVEDPAFTGVLDLLAAMGLVPVGVPVDDEGVDPERLRRAVGGGAHAVVITPRAQNPTGAALTGARARDLASVFDDHPEVLVVEDDHAGDVGGSPAVTSLGAGHPRWAVVRSMSKSLGPDLRVALLAGDDLTVSRVEGRQRVGVGWVSRLLQHVVADVWGRASTTAVLRRAAKAYAGRRNALIDALSARDVPAVGRSGLNVWVPVPEEQSVVAGLLAHGWAVAAGERFRLRTPPGIRITTASLDRDDVDALAGAVAAALRPSTGRTS